MIDSSLHVELSYKGRRVPLPAWVRSLQNCTLKRKSQLNELCNYVKNYSDISDQYPILSTLTESVFVKGNVPYPFDVVRFALYLRYTSLSAYEYVKSVFPLPTL